MSSGLAPIRVANDWRKLRATEKKDWSSTMCGRLLAATDTCTALSATRGIAACAAKFKYVASSIGNHSFFQSIDDVIFSSVCSGSKGQCPWSASLRGWHRWRAGKTLCLYRHFWDRNQAHPRIESPAEGAHCACGGW